MWARLWCWLVGHDPLEGHDFLGRAWKRCQRCKELLWMKGQEDPNLLIEMKARVWKCLTTEPFYQKLFESCSNSVLEELIDEIFEEALGKEG